MESRQLEEDVFDLATLWVEEDEGFHSGKWIEIDATLASPEFAIVKDVRICALPDADANPPATLLPTCHARGIISFLDTELWQPWQS
jgi:hypothetical protein